jgi:alkanesulfonate monooxygenase SsuD/methylene tetrahydromethanopterin reductase-like flavin-dependent oxidoreductase (luciferase family)
MQFGLFGSAAARRGGPEFDSAEGFRDFMDYNIEAEALGFHSTFVVEHHFTGYGQVSATINLLTWLGARTRWLRLGTAVMVLPWHNPVLLAEQAATLDLLSGGRLDFGIGKGYRYNEFAGFCVPMAEADARFDEALAVILKAWTTDEPFSHRGKYWQFDNIMVEPPTAQRPRPPIWMGAGSENSIRRVAAQGFNLLLGQYASPEDVAHNIAVYKSEVEARGRRFDPMQIGVTRAFFVAENPAEREAAMERRLANRVRQLKLATRPDGTVHGDRTAPPAIREGSTRSAPFMEAPTRSPGSSTRCAGPVSAMCCSTAAARVAAPAAARAYAALRARSCRPSRSGDARHILIKIEAYRHARMGFQFYHRDAGLRHFLVRSERQEFVKISLPERPAGRQSRALISDMKRVFRLKRGCSTISSLKFPVRQGILTAFF